MAARKPEFVIVHGGWHTPASYAKIRQGLEAAGHTVHIPPLLTMSGQVPPKDDLYTDSAYIRDYVTNLANKGKEIIVVMHSYGGQVGTNSLVGLGDVQRKTGDGVIRLVYVSAFALQEGGSMLAWVRDHGHGDLLPLAFDFQDTGFVSSRDPKKLVIGEGFIDDGEMDDYIATFTTWASKSWSDEIKQCAWREIPVTYIQVLQDMTVPLDYQKEFIEHMRKAGASVDVLSLDTGHCPNITKPAELVEMLEQIAADAVAS